MYLSIVIPAYNEAGRIGESLDKLVRYLRTRPYGYEIVVVDDGSTDATREIVFEKLKGLPFSLIANSRNMGKGYSVRRGMLEAKGERLLFTDADFSAPIEELDKLLGAIEAGCDIAIGSRALKDSQVIVRQTWIREHMGKTFNFIARFLTFKGIMDSQCGFKCFRHP
ncbi:MAG: glycosyltransferase family 2 protein, partial [Candidatus Omnitrophica bacterium]|nr:glycosyltransferase family 2 protein [Candidatus Omnitrophota bacterium]